MGLTHRETSCPVWRPCCELCRLPSGPQGDPSPPTPTAPPTAVSSEPDSWPEGSAQICWCGVGRVKDSWNPSVDRDPGLPEDRGVLVTRPVHRTHQVTFCYLERLWS